jgi:cytochrome c-type biogenesis protein CcmH/NrfF
MAAVYQLMEDGAVTPAAPPSSKRSLLLLSLPLGLLVLVALMMHYLGVVPD